MTGNERWKNLNGGRVVRKVRRGRDASLMVKVKGSGRRIAHARDALHLKVISLGVRFTSDR